jgi:hypothetical protein
MPIVCQGERNATKELAVMAVIKGANANSSSQIDVDLGNSSSQLHGPSRAIRADLKDWH